MKKFTLKIVMTALVALSSCAPALRKIFVSHVMRKFKSSNNFLQLLR